MGPIGLYLAHFPAVSSQGRLKQASSTSDPALLSKLLLLCPGICGTTTMLPLHYSLERTAVHWLGKLRKVGPRCYHRRKLKGVSLLEVSTLTAD